VQGDVQEDVVQGGRFDMETCLRRFAAHYREIFNVRDESFWERHARLVFLSYLRPLINGAGFYHMESELTDLRRMDLVVDYGLDQFVIELKLWGGDKSHRDAIEQLAGYLRGRGAQTGYLLTFDFRKEGARTPGETWTTSEAGDARIFDVVL
jgi:hypothetical protein